jgi:hypothetical protein
VPLRFLLAPREHGRRGAPEPSAVTVSDGDGGPEGAVRRRDARGTVRIATGVDADAAGRATVDRVSAGLMEARRR